MAKLHLLLIGVLFNVACLAQNGGTPIYKSKAYSIYPDSVVQNKFVAKVVSSHHITSTYKSPSKTNFTANIKFKFTINGRIDEMKAYTDHHFFVKYDGDVTPIIKFGHELKQTNNSTVLLKPDTKIKIRLDLNEVFNDFKTKGYYVNFNNDTLLKKDFKTVYVGGETSPMTWNFAGLYKIPELELKDSNNDGIYETTVNLNPSAAPFWKLSKNIAAFPQYSSSYPISDAIYNMSLDEMENAIEKDSTFRTGIDWPGVWTRDISYSIILSMAYLQPQVAINSLLKKVNKNGRIIQDTGSGGSYPVSTDRMIWATAAWEVYKATGDSAWLKKVYPIIKNSVEDDLLNLYDGKTSLLRGESSFLDWRSQTYPTWVQPLDIYNSECLGTNAVHYNAYQVLVQMATLLANKRDIDKYSMCADRAKSAINDNLWQPSKGYYAQYLYGRNYLSASPKSEALGQALSIYFDIANPAQQKTIVASTPVTPFGIPCIYPQIPDIFAYHNNAVWPFVQSYWALASAKAGNQQSVLESISAIYRSAALFLTNKENFVATNGDYSGTAINSSNMLWSLSGNLALVHRVFFGIEFKANSLLFRPFVPQAYAGTRMLTNFKYRNAILNINLTGYGNKVVFCMLDDVLMTNNEIPADLKGVHNIKIALSSENFANDTIHKTDVYFSPPTPLLTYNKGILKWNKIADAKNYTILRNGKSFALTTKLALAVKDSVYAEYQIIATNNKNYASFASEPLPIYSTKPLIFELGDSIPPVSQPVKQFTGKGFVEISKTQNLILNIPVTITQSAYYAIDFKYANGNGDLGQQNKAAIRTLLVDNRTLKAIVFPQRGDNVWNDWGFTNAATYYFPKGTHIIQLTFRPANENMNLYTNQAMLDYVRLTKLN